MSDSATCYHYWIQNCHWCSGASAANRNHNVAHFGSRFFGWVFESNCCTWSLANDAEFIINLAIINLNHHAISIKWQITTRFAQMLDFLEYLLDIRENILLLGNLETKGF